MKVTCICRSRQKKILTYLRTFVICFLRPPLSPSNAKARPFGVWRLAFGAFAPRPARFDSTSSVKPREAGSVAISKAGAVLAFYLRIADKE
jgi:hypothetical protein